MVVVGKHILIISMYVKNSREIDVNLLCVVSEQWESVFNARQSYFHFIKSEGRGRL